MKPLDALIRQYVKPVVKGENANIAKRTVRVSASSGDRAFIEFTQHFVDPDKTVFDVTLHIAPVSYWEWLNRQHADAGLAPDGRGALASRAVMPPKGVAWDPDPEGFFPSRWAFLDEGIDACGELLAQELERSVFPLARHLLNRSALLEEMKNPSAPTVLRMSPIMQEIVLIIDDYPEEQVSQLLVSAEESGTPASFVEWARRRLALRP
ncbi:hypothetical protein [Streptomyces sp. CA-251247]|uniref:hypothetical protein n=1 Tax=Streptomyces sp. CA-251247 TaxID=3240062 RepID=UPI003D94573C